MSRFFSGKYSELEAYTPGEQPQDRKYLKLNTNESPFPTSPKAMKTVENVRPLQLYSDPQCGIIRDKLAEVYGVDRDEIIAVNGSDELLNFTIMAFADEEHPLAFPDITYGFYPVFAALNHVPFEEIPLTEDFKINVDDYKGINKNIIIANPNAPTGIALPLSDIETILKTNPDNVILIDEAYVDFGAESAVGLIHKYDNLIVAQTFSKSRSFAGARLGMGFACRELINDLNTIRFSTNPYNVNSCSMYLGTAILDDEEYTKANCLEIIKNREYTVQQLREMGFEVTDSSANFIFARTPDMDGGELYRKLKDEGVLVRHFFKKERICQYNRISIGTREQMEAFLAAVRKIMGE
ncbi:MAG: histidinol-phosphate transaminase [Lachnospiraceae bacterium]|nr:histidinol-phosphate transaminase [Lachnospiraceae bacterium]